MLANCLCTAFYEVIITIIAIIIIKAADIYWGLIMFQTFRREHGTIQAVDRSLANHKSSLMTPVRLPKDYEQILVHIFLSPLNEVD